MNYVLVVDDSAVDRMLIGRIVESQTGYAVRYAANGLEAVEVMEARLPLVVITDLNMPEMDGMQLVAEIRRRFATVPVILVTQQGSEDIALAALLHGAADFVPKASLAGHLRNAILGVTALTAGETPRDHLRPFLDYQEVRYTLDNDLELVASAASQLRELAAAFGLVDEADGIRLAKALDEALRNAICHGNLEIPQPLPGDGLAAAVAARRAQPPYRERRVHVAVSCSHSEARYVIRDDGAGFAADRVLASPPQPSQISQDAGRGLVLIRAFVDEVQFNATGTEITLVKRRK